MNAHCIINVSRSESGNLNISPHFKYREFACNDGSDPIFIDLYLVLILEMVREHFKAPVIIHSAYRTPDYNASAAVGGSQHSYHCRGMAADIHVQGIPNNKVADYVRQSFPASCGVGRYDSFTHVDTRDKIANWKG